jgi:energy-converting hydrogenase Eha subunit E
MQDPTTYRTAPGRRDPVVKVLDPEVFSKAESALLLGAFLTLLVSMFSFTAL